MLLAFLVARARAGGPASFCHPLYPAIHLLDAGQAVAAVLPTAPGPTIHHAPPQGLMHAMSTGFMGDAGMQAWQGMQMPQYMSVPQQYMTTPQQCMAAPQQCMAAPQQCMAAPQQYMAATQPCMGAAPQQCMPSWQCTQSMVPPMAYGQQQWNGGMPVQSLQCGQPPAQLSYGHSSGCGHSVPCGQPQTWPCSQLVQPLQFTQVPNPTQSATTPMASGQQQWNGAMPVSSLPYSQPPAQPTFEQLPSCGQQIAQQIACAPMAPSGSAVSYGQHELPPQQPQQPQQRCAVPSLPREAHAQAFAAEERPQCVHAMQSSATEIAPVASASADTASRAVMAGRQPARDIGAWGYASGGEPFDSGADFGGPDSLPVMGDRLAGILYEMDSGSCLPTPPIPTDETEQFMAFLSSGGMPVLGMEADDALGEEPTKVPLRRRRKKPRPTAVVDDAVRGPAASQAPAPAPAPPPPGIRLSQCLVQPPSPSMDTADAEGATLDSSEADGATSGDGSEAHGPPAAKLSVLEVRATKEAMRQIAQTAAVGGVPQFIEVYWEDELMWHVAEVVRFDEGTQAHTIRYQGDGGARKGGGATQKVQLGAWRWMRVLTPTEIDAIAVRVKAASASESRALPAPCGECDGCQRRVAAEGSLALGKGSRRKGGAAEATRCAAVARAEHATAVATAQAENAEYARWEAERPMREAQLQAQLRASAPQRRKAVSAPSAVGRPEGDVSDAVSGSGVAGGSGSAAVTSSLTQGIYCHYERSGMSTPPPPIAETILDTNDESTRFLVQWAGKPRAAATWQSKRRVDAMDAKLVTRFLEERRASFNRELEPLLSLPDSSGVTTLIVPRGEAERCATHLRERWLDGRLPLHNGRSCRGFRSYGKTLDTHDSELQGNTTLLISNAILPAVRRALPGFEAMELHLLEWLQQKCARMPPRTHMVYLDPYACTHVPALASASACTCSRAPHFVSTCLHAHACGRAHLSSFDAARRIARRVGSFSHRSPVAPCGRGADDTVVELFYAHALRQGPETLSSTGFDVHQDTEDYDFIEYSAIVKLTPDSDGAPPSEMHVMGAERSFQYAATAGAVAVFHARLHHASVAPRPGADEHLKIAYFFRASTKGERRAKRSFAVEAGSDVSASSEEALAQKRLLIAHDLHTYSTEAQALAKSQQSSLQAAGSE